jgi:predicted dehydrogenase
MIEAAIVGLGRWGRILVESVQGKSERIRFVRGVARRPERLGDFAARHGLDLGADLPAALADPRVRAVVLATPHSQHADQIVAAAAAAKHVFVEKPMTLTHASAQAAAAAAGRAGVVLAVGYNRRFSPLMRDLRARVEAGALGDVLHLEANYSLPSGLRYQAGGWRADPAESPAGGMTGMGLHLVDAMVSLAGPIESVFARSLRRALAIPIDDTTSMLLSFKLGMSGYLGTLTATAPAWRLQVLGSKGWAEVRDETRLELRALDGKSEFVEAPVFDTERAELEAFAAAIEGEAPYPIPVPDAIHGVAVLEAVIRSSEQGQQVPVARPGETGT